MKKSSLGVRRDFCCVRCEKVEKLRTLREIKYLGACCEKTLRSLRETSEIPTFIIDFPSDNP